MKTFTRTGDEGFTSLLGGMRARKDDSRIEAVGALDELNTAVGWALSQARQTTHVVIGSILEPIQRDLFTLGARIAALGTQTTPRELPSEAVERLERDLDALAEDLPPLKGFIFPGGCELACRLHLCRAVCRRAERTIVHMFNPIDARPLLDPQALAYLNRLSDLLFTLARLANRDAGESETAWTSRKEESSRQD
jgi:cob(I)alamin adenosyltransferase